MRKGDLILIVVLVIIGVAGLIYNFLLVPQLAQGKRALVEVDGRLERELSLARNQQNIRINTDVGYNVIDVADGKIRVSEANCPDQICVHFGWIQRAGQMIVCLPHKLIVRVDDSEGLGLDGVSY